MSVQRLMDEVASAKENRTGIQTRKTVEHEAKYDKKIEKIYQSTKCQAKKYMKEEEKMLNHHNKLARKQKKVDPSLVKDN